MGRRAAWGEAAEEELPQYYGSSEDFKRMVRNQHPELQVPEHEIIYLGEHAAWDLSKEAAHPPDTPCPDLETIAPGSLLCCPKCHHSGHEHRLNQQRQLAGYPPAERPKPRVNQEAAKTPPRRGKGQQWWRDLAWSKSRSRSQSSPRPPQSKRRTA